MEIIRRTTSSGVLSLAKPRRLNTLVIGFILIGQLVGSSGGILFLAEFRLTGRCSNRHYTSNRVMDNILVSLINIALGIPIGTTGIVGRYAKEVAWVSV
jgi:Na+/H+ antiporter NhaC